MKQLLFLAVFALLPLFSSAQAQSGDVVVTDSSSTWFLPKGAKVQAVLILVQVGVDIDSNQIFRPEITYRFDGGSWAQQPEPWSQWQTIRAGRDSIDYTQATWEVSDESVLSSTPITLAKYCPVGCPPTITYVQYRIEEKSGAVQSRTQRRPYRFTPGISKFQKLIRQGPGQ